MYSFSISSSFKQMLSSALLAAVIVGFVPVFAQAAEEDSVDVSVSGMVVTANYTINSPCIAYTLDWGDGEKIEQESGDMMCIQVLQDVTSRHTYEKKGTYTITFKHAGETEIQTVTVPATVKSFALTDVKSITALWVDPNEMMADEEYTIYTITLDTGEIIKVNAGGFTTQEWRNQQFVEAGYTGDVEKLTEMATQINEEVIDNAEANSQELIKLQKQIIELLQQIIALLKR